MEPDIEKNQRIPKWNYMAPRRRTRQPLTDVQPPDGKVCCVFSPCLIKESSENHRPHMVTDTTQLNKINKVCIPTMCRILWLVLRYAGWSGGAGLL